MTTTPNPAAKTSRSAQPRPVMKEVADRAGVALSSVSRVLNGHPDVSEVMRNRVIDAVAALGYEPDMLAQSLRTGATMTIGFLVGDISNPLMSQIALGAETKLRAAGYTTMLTNSINDPTLDVQHLRLFQQRRVDGLLLSLSDEADPAINAALERLEVPGVLVDRQLDGSPFAAVLSDHASGIGAAVTKLVELGHTRIGMVSGNPNVRPSRERASALRKTCRSASGVSAVVKASAFSSEHGYRATLDMLRAVDAPTAVIAGSNQILVGVLRALHELELSVPGDISLITCDDIPLAEFLTPPITTVSRDFAAMGHLAAELLLDQLAGGPARTEVLPTGFRLTPSCATPRHRSPQRKPRA
jgi:LacI family transcriptional regulator